MGRRSRRMKEQLISHKQMLEYGILKPYSNIFGFSTTRHGGCGEGPYATFNCTHYCGDSPEHVKTNLESLAALLPECPHVIVIPRQTHTTNVRVITDVPTSEATDLEAGLPWIFVDEMHFTNVVFNLMDNAMKYKRPDVPLLLVS